MTDSIDVLLTTKIAYTIYALVILSLFAWFAYRVRQEGDTAKMVRPKLFYSYIGLLIFIGVSIHILTFNTIPWVKIDFQRDHIKANKVFNIVAQKQRFTLPNESKKLMIDCNDLVRFHVESKDWTYGFGLVRQDNSLVFQMQVVPGSKNDLVWHFQKNGIYHITSTEYSGYARYDMKTYKDLMMLKNAVEVTGCKIDDKRSMPANNEGGKS